MAGCKCVVYTPQNEHFGIVPIEAMAVGRPVIACNSGGPVESIVHGVTGLLSEPCVLGFANAMVRIVVEKSLAASMATAARLRARDKFSRGMLGQEVGAVLAGIVDKVHTD